MRVAVGRVPGQPARLGWCERSGAAQTTTQQQEQHTEVLTRVPFPTRWPPSGMAKNSTATFKAQLTVLPAPAQALVQGALKVRGQAPLRLCACPPARRPAGPPAHLWHGMASVNARMHACMCAMRVGAVGDLLRSRRSGFDVRRRCRPRLLQAAMSAPVKKKVKKVKKDKKKKKKKKTKLTFDASGFG